jgi:hypothetical protein
VPVAPWGAAAIRCLRGRRTRGPFDKIVFIAMSGLFACFSLALAAVRLRRRMTSR